MKKRMVSLMVVLTMLCAFVPAAPASASANIKIGDYIQMGTYYGEPILWRCVDIDENGPLILSDKIICLKPFDAKTSTNNATGSHSRNNYHSSWGSNYWVDSNMRSWLNSTASAGNVNWLCGNPPSEDYVWIGYNDYANEAGFLTNFSRGEINAMKSVSQKSIVSYPELMDDIYTTGSEFHTNDYRIANVVQNYDTAYAEYVTDKMFLMDVKQVKAVYDNRTTLGDKYYIGEPTAQAVANSEYKREGYLETEKKWYYWLRIPEAGDTYARNMRHVTSDGDIYFYAAYCGDGGVRPAFYLNLPSFSIKSGLGLENDPYIGYGTESDGGTITPTHPPSPQFYAPEHLTGTVRFNTGNKKAGFTYDDNYFANSSYTYNHDLARMSLRFAMSAFGKKPYTTHYTNAEALLKDLHYDNIQANDDYKKKPDMNRPPKVRPKI